MSASLTEQQKLEITIEFCDFIEQRIKSRNTMAATLTAAIKPEVLPSVHLFDFRSNFVDTTVIVGIDSVTGESILPSNFTLDNVKLVFSSDERMVNHLIIIDNEDTQITAIDDIHPDRFGTETMLSGSIPIGVTCASDLLKRTVVP
jgi:hypothetical protein